MAFNWKQFLRRHKINYVTSGPNVSKGFIAVRCPFCGEADPSEHMTIKLGGSFWRCWRNHSHGGSSRAVLIRRLLRCTEEEARRFAEEEVTVAPATDELAERLSRLRSGLLLEVPKNKVLEFPRGFMSLMSDNSMASAFVGYMRQRGYRKSEVEWLVQAYDLRYTIVGDFAWRLIIPVCDREGVLQTWTGRAVSANVEPRYKTLSVRDGPALMATSSTLLGLPLLWAAPSPRALIICEGPFDAMRMTASGYALGVYATCLFGLQVHPDQRTLLQELGTHFSQLYLLLDTPAQLQRLPLGNQFFPLSLKPLELPSGVKDPGDLSAIQALELCIDLAA